MPNATEESEELAEEPTAKLVQGPNDEQTAEKPAKPEEPEEDAKPDKDAKTLTQAEIDALVSKRTERARKAQHEAEERAKAAEEEAASIRSKAEREALVAKVAADKGVPASLLVGDDEDSLTAYADEILKFASSKLVSGVVPGDTGAAPQVASTPVQQFGDWWEENFG